MNKRILISVIAVASVLVLLVIGVTTAYLTDWEVRDNVITIGKINIELDEGSFDETVTKDVVPGSRFEKAPKLTNSGNKDEFVFMRITVPTAAVQLLNETDPNKGQPKGLTGQQQLFRLIADGEPITAIDPVTGRDIDITYRSGDAEAEPPTEGWVLLNAAYNKSKTENGVTTRWDEYVFGYNKKMTPNAQTVPLFQEAQLKSFIDTDVTGEVSIGVYAYGIQADNLKPAGTPNLDAALLDEDALQAVYTIVKNKAGI